MTYTADDLTSAVRRRARLPSDAITDAEILLFADEETQTVIIPLIRDMMSEYYVKQKDFTVVSGTATYRIPARAQSGSLRDVTLRDVSGNEYPVPQIPLESRGLYELGASYWWPKGVAYTVQGDHVVLLPTPTQSGFTLRMRYFRRPSRLVLAANTLLITSTTPGKYYGTVPATFTTSLLYDAIQANPNFDAFGDDAAATLVTTGPGGELDSASLGTQSSNEIAAGDYIALAATSPIVQLPVELQPVLFHATTAAVLESLGDRDGAALAVAQSDKKLEAAKALLDIRVKSGAPRLVNWSSPLRASRYRIR